MYPIVRRSKHRSAESVAAQQCHHQRRQHRHGLHGHSTARIVSNNTNVDVHQVLERHAVTTTTTSPAVIPVKILEIVVVVVVVIVGTLRLMLILIFRLGRLSLAVSSMIARCLLVVPGSLLLTRIIGRRLLLLLRLVVLVSGHVNGDLAACHVLLSRSLVVMLVLIAFGLVVVVVGFLGAALLLATLAEVSHHFCCPRGCIMGRKRRSYKIENFFSRVYRRGGLVRQFYRG